MTGGGREWASPHLAWDEAERPLLGRPAALGDQAWVKAMKANDLEATVALYNVVDHASMPLPPPASK